MTEAKSGFTADTWKDTPADTIVNGFRKARIVLFNDDVVPLEKFYIHQLKRWDDDNVSPNIANENNKELMQNMP